MDLPQMLDTFARMPAPEQQAWWRMAAGLLAVVVALLWLESRYFKPSRRVGSWLAVRLVSVLAALLAVAAVLLPARAVGGPAALGVFVLSLYTLGPVVWRPCAGRALGAARTLARRKPGAGPHRPGHCRRAHLRQPARAKRPANRRTRRGPAPRAARQQPPAGPHRATRAALPAARRGAHLHPVTAGHPRQPPAARGATPRWRPMARPPPPRGPPQLLHPRQRRAPDVVRPGTPSLPAPALGPKQRRTHQGRVHAPTGV